MKNYFNLDEESPTPTTIMETKNMNTVVSGKITERRFHNQNYYTQITTPSSDEYERPGTLEIRSSQSLGDVGQVIEQEVKVGGYKSKPYSFTDRETGEVRNVQPVKITLEAVQ